MIDDSEGSSRGTATAEASAWAAAGSVLERIYARGRDHIPTAYMLDYAVAGIDRDMLDARYRDHLASCVPCSSGIDAAERMRPTNQCYLLEVPEFAHCEASKEEYKLKDDAKARLARFIRDDTDALLIVAGEANPLVYDGPVEAAIEERARNALRRGAPLPTVICGPAMGLGGDIRSPEDAILPRLAERGLLTLFAARHRLGVHFRVNAGGEAVFTEAYHGAGDERPRTGVWYRGRAISNLFRRRFAAIVDLGLATPAGRDGFEYVPMDQVKAVAARVGNGVFDTASREQIRAWFKHTS